MRILLLGEYSGFYTNLAIGFERLGHEVMLFSNGHGWMQLKGGRPYPAYGGRFFDRQWQKWNLKKDRRLFAGYDLVFVINAEFISDGLRANSWDWIRAKNKTVVYTVCGQRDSYMLRSFPYLRKHMFLNSDGHIDMVACAIGPDHIKRCDRLVDESDGLITIGGTYDLAYSEVDIKKACLPLPVDTTAIKFEPMEIERELLLFHGKQHRPDCKGTPTVLEAVDLLKTKRKNFVFQHSGGHSLVDYLNILKSVHISIDQCKSMGYGMNAVFSMALGKVVCSGNEPEHSVALGLPVSPVVNLPYSVEGIMKVLLSLVDEPRSKLVELGRENRRYVERYHKAEVVAKRYISFCEGL